MSLLSSLFCIECWDLPFYFLTQDTEVWRDTGFCPQLRSEIHVPWLLSVVSLSDHTEVIWDSFSLIALYFIHVFMLMFSVY